MANVLKKTVAQTTYIVELTQDEIDLIAGIASDLTDLPREVYMAYPVDGSPMVLSERGLEAARSIAAGLSSTEGEDYDYFAFWDYAPTS